MKALALMLAPALAASAASAGTLPSAAPNPVSPGSTSHAIPGADLCPTFSWSSAADFEYFELAMFELPQDYLDAGAELKPFTVVTVPGAGRSWTPSVDRCTEPGKMYVWLVRGRSESASTEWSSESWFTSPSSAGPDPRATRALLAGDGPAPFNDQSSGLAGDDGSMGNSIAVDSMDAVRGVEPELTIVDGMTAAEIAVLRVPGQSQGRIASDSEFNSRALGRLQAARIELLLPPPSLAAGARLSAGPASVATATLKFGLGECFGAPSNCDDLEVDALVASGVIVQGGPINFSNSFTGYVGSGGSGFFEVPAVTSVRVDDNAADCGGRPVVEVRLAETDADQIGIQVICGNAP